MAESDFLQLMPHTITKNAYSSIDGYGKATFSTGLTSYRGLLTYENKLVKAMDGKEKMSSANVILNCTGTINPDDKLNLPNGTSPPILSITSYSDNIGTHNTQVYFG